MSTTTQTTDIQTPTVAPQGDGVVASEVVQSEPAAKPTENTEVLDASDEEQTESEESEELETKTGEEKPGKKKGGFQRKIDKLTAKAATAEREREYWRQEALKHQKPAEEKKVVEQKTETPAEGKPDPEKYASPSDYLEALADWKADQKFAQRDQAAKEEAMKADEKKIVDAYLKRRDEFVSKTPDFDDVIDEVVNVPMSISVQEAVLHAENGPALLYELAKDPEQYKKICAMDFAAANRAIGRIEARLEKLSETPELPKELKTTKAPAPVKPLNALGAKVSASLDNLDYDTYKARRAEQSKRN